MTREELQKSESNPLYPAGQEPNIIDWQNAAIAHFKSGRADDGDWNMMASCLLGVSEDDGLGELDAEIAAALISPPVGTGERAAFQVGDVVECAGDPEHQIEEFSLIRGNRYVVFEVNERHKIVSLGGVGGWHHLAKFRLISRPATIDPEIATLLRSLVKSDNWHNGNCGEGWIAKRNLIEWADTIMKRLDERARPATIDRAKVVEALRELMGVANEKYATTWEGLSSATWDGARSAYRAVADRLGISKEELK